MILRVILEMKASFIILEYLLIIVMQPACQSTRSDFCKIDAALSYTGDNKLYFFKGDKYARYSDNDFVDFVGGTSD